MAVLSTSERINGYTVQNLIKANHYTETYRVVDGDNRPFFLKLFILNNLPSKLMNEETKTVREIEYCRVLKHRNIVSHVADGTLEKESGSYQYYLTNYFSGQVLADRLATGGPMSEEEAIAVFRAVLTGLQYMHSQATPLCHNDITPANIVLNDAMNGEAVIIDLGHTCTPCAGIAEFDTNDLDVLYHAKETMVGIFDQQTDIFSACAVLYAMLTGSAPWELDIAATGDYKERFKEMWQYRQSHPLQMPEGAGNKVKDLLQNGLALKASDRFKSVNDVLAVVDDKQPEGGEQGGKRTDSGRGNMGDGGKGQGAQDGDDDLPIEIRRGGGNGFADIAGMQELKDYLTQKVIFMIENKEIAEQYRITPPNGMLLYGPPGCGKTFFAEKFAEETKFNFMLVKSSDIGSSLVHGTEAKIQKLFAKAEKNSPIVICFDEFDALVPIRGAHGSEYQSGEVNEFLAQMNNCAKKGIFIIATSNRPDKIDPAILRTGRIDKQVFVPLPDMEARKEMFKMYLAKRPTTEDINIDEYAAKTEGYIASDIAFIVNDAAMTAAFTRKPISHELMCTSLNNIQPSLQKEVIEEYSQIQKKMNGIQRRAVVQGL
ncbi:MAG: AAA family ATPase [Paludibacteraceae bacterium]|nr:AAA family ATPase [Paludibacteraceae bacterium]